MSNNIKNELDHPGDDSYCYNYYLAQAHANPELHGISGPANYEHQRGVRQMSHYFDVNQMPTAVPSAQSSTAKPAVKPTAAQLRYYREQKEKKKQMKNKWLYE
jgi:hypothetical protein